MIKRLEEIKLGSEKLLNDAKSLKDIEELRIKYLGKKGELTELLKSMGALSAEERPKMGKLVNELREHLENAVSVHTERLKEAALNERILLEKIDVTMPGEKIRPLGHKHPITLVIDAIKDIFMGMGYEIAEGPDIELDYYNFEALNIPENHPAKDEQDTFYVDGGFVLRSQTSSVQVRTMETHELPIRIIAPGRVFRSDEVDATHSPVFHQLEGLVIDENITMSDLKGVLNVFAKALLGENTEVRFRPHHFQFTEPSAEMDVSCFVCGGKGCRTCKQTGWIELLGCGMVHPRVLEMSGIDPKKYSGFAFGMGLERIAMQRFNIPDLRLMYENDVRFLKQF
ncbi:phenylalanine--tRNA ligase subunit alpha [Anaeropeptidivorans aminofermentans]|uniref:phenylalanine--tRNA ligase subunit alpha n=1 Tax=Anaeropeptidivorans aminofermentans TaxID=2934315 RepID=UPI002024F351|nr:phenylalanine--tRNA ligase subunit alpha [Anaeropeptidivorans aminofermentans]